MSTVCSMLKWGPVLCVRAECCGAPVPDALAACSAGASFPKSGCWAIFATQAHQGQLYFSIGERLYVGIKLFHIHSWFQVLTACVYPFPSPNFLSPGVPLLNLASRWQGTINGFFPLRSPLPGCCPSQCLGWGGIQPNCSPNRGFVVIVCMKELHLPAA